MKTMRKVVYGGILCAMAVSGCTLESPDAPSLTAPSTTALSLSVTATPDILPEDGTSQSVIRIRAVNMHGQPISGLPLRVDTVDGGSIVDFGTLSARNVTTNSNGEAVVIFTAPKSLFPGVDSGTEVEIRVTEVGTDFGVAVPRFVSIRLVPQSVVLLPGAPIPSFTFSPSNPNVGTRVFFDASTSRDDDGTIVRYQWNYGDGEFEEGVQNFKDYTAPGTYFVTLTVTDNQGKSSSLTRTITVSGS